jgi:hypothetical protein
VQAACVVGVAEAVMLEHFIYWWRFNAANDKNYCNGNYWTYNKRETFSKIFSYLTPRQIQTITDKLKSSGYIVTGIFNKKKFDRTLWYSITEKTFDLYKMDFQTIENWQKVTWLFDRFGAFNKNVKSTIQNGSFENTLDASENPFENEEMPIKCDLSVSTHLTNLLNRDTDLLNGFNQLQKKKKREREKRASAKFFLKMKKSLWKLKRLLKVQKCQKKKKRLC